MRDHNCSNCGKAGHCKRTCSRPDVGTIFCGHCKLEKPKSEFYRIRGICKACCTKTNGKYSKIRDNSPKGKLARHLQRLLFKAEILENYGGVCVCCGEINIGFLTIDHENDDGAAFKKKFGKIKLYNFLKRNNYPKNLGLRVMCYNCNSGRAKNGGICPHKLNPIDRIEKQFGLS